MAIPECDDIYAGEYGEGDNGVNKEHGKIEDKNRSKW
jgi:hypothetical protein